MARAGAVNGYMRIFGSIIVAAALSTSASAQKTGQFDLHCIGEQFIGELKNIAKKENRFPVNIVYKIDLDSGRWCSGKCHETFAIEGYNAKIILLKKEKDTDPYWDEEVSLNRETGQLIDRVRMGPPLSTMMTTASCSPKQFSGFPTLKF